MNTELKQYVFAGYIGQKVLYWHRYHIKGTTGVLNGTNLAASCSKEQESHLQLRPLSAITESEAVEVAKIKRWNEMLNDIGNANAVMRFLFNNENDIRVPFEIASAIYQYLQQQGFALPVWFKGEFYSVERLVELGIYKLTE